ncbi:hypothetical protein A2U01_0100564, partial [Trifolium medium]|nr:hypothetical protein [Trifolium medium]
GEVSRLRCEETGALELREGQSCALVQNLDRVIGKGKHKRAVYGWL